MNRAMSAIISVILLFAALMILPGMSMAVPDFEAALSAETAAETTAEAVETTAEVTAEAPQTEINAENPRNAD